MDLKRGIDLAVEKVVKYLLDNSKKIESHEQIEQVATISANNDSEIGKLIAHAMSKVGKEGAITVTVRTRIFCLQLGMLISRIGWKELAQRS